MKKITLLIILFFINCTAFAQDTEPPSAPSNLLLWPFVHRNITVIWYESTDNVAVTTYEIYLNGTLYQTVPYNGSNPQNVSYDNLPNGSYCFKVLAKDAAGNISGFSNEECMTIYDLIYESIPNTEIYLSGMLNYAGDEKLIEIKNFTNNTVDLSEYELRMSTDGSGTWDTTYTFPINSSIDPGGYTFIIGHPNATICSNIIDDYNSNITNFNGNDVIGLFKNNIFIDAIGELGSSQNFVAEGEALTRLYVVNPIPSNTFEIDEWRTGLDNGNGVCPGWGYQDLGLLLNTDDVVLNSFQIYPNPIKTNILQFKSQNNQTIDSVSILDINGRIVLNSTNIINNQLDIQSLTQGVYFVQIQSDTKISTHKLIRQ